MTLQLRFGQWLFCPDTHRLSTATCDVVLEPKVARLLTYFLAHPDVVLSHERLVIEVWDGQVVSDEAVRRAISSLRQALATDNSDSFIKTVHKKGYLASFPSAPLPVATEQAPTRESPPPTNDAVKRRIWPALALLAIAVLGAAAWWRFDSAQPPKNIPTLVVLPLVNHNPDNVPNYVPDGIADELINRLAQFSTLKVVARTSAFQFKDKRLSIIEIGRQLKVSHALEGSVLDHDGRVRVVVQLVDCLTGFPKWAQTFERDAANPEQLTSTIAEAVANALQLPANPQPSVVRQVNPAAYDDYLRGRVLLAQRVDGNLQAAVNAFDHAITMAPDYSPAHSGRGFALAASAYWGAWMPLRDAVTAGRMAAEEALRLDNNNAEAYLVRATTALQSSQIVAAQTDFEHALRLAPGQVDVMNYYGDFLRYVGQLRDAEQIKRRAMERDPLFFVHPRDLSEILSYQGRYADALVMAERAVTLGGGRWAQEAVFWAQLRLHQYDAARSTLTTLCPPTSNTIASCLSKQIAFLAATARRDDALVKLNQLETLARQSGGWIESYAARAALYANDLHDFDRAAEAMRAALARDEVWLMWPLLNAEGGAKLPEEMSQNAAWLAVWQEEKLAELMRAYRHNLLAFRETH